MMSSDEDDYMADSFVVSAKSALSSSLVHHKPSASRPSRNAGVPAPVLPAKKRRLHEIEKEMRDQGLGTAISGDNKGFAMMARMGYKAGQSIGKASAQGIVEPIGIQVKSDRGGLGREEALRQLQERRLEVVRKRKMGQLAGGRNVVSVEDFRRRLTQQANERQLAADLGKCQRACEDLDQKQSIATPDMVWFWPDRRVPKPEDDEESEADPKTEDKSENDEDDDDEVEYEPTEKMEMLTTYLRTSYSYCHWCGVQYEDGSDLQNSCPGPTKDDH